MRTNRWAIAVAGTVAMICLGTVYSWSLFTQPLIAAFGWSNTTTTWTFALAIFFLGVGAIIGGRWQDRRGPRPVAMTGVILWGVANVLAGLGTAFEMKRMPAVTFRKSIAQSAQNCGVRIAWDGA